MKIHRICSQNIFIFYNDIALVYMKSKPVQRQYFFIPCYFAVSKLHSQIKIYRLFIEYTVLNVLHLNTINSVNSLAFANQIKCLKK